MATCLNIVLKYLFWRNTAIDWKMPCMLQGLFVQRASSFQKYWILELDLGKTKTNKKTQSLTKVKSFVFVGSFFCLFWFCWFSLFFSIQKQTNHCFFVFSPTNDLKFQSLIYSQDDVDNDDTSMLQWGSGCVCVCVSMQHIYIYREREDCDIYIYIYLCTYPAHWGQCLMVFWVLHIQFCKCMNLQTIAGNCRINHPVGCRWSNPWGLSSGAARVFRRSHTSAVLLQRSCRGSQVTEGFVVKIVRLTIWQCVKTLYPWWTSK